MGNVYKQEAQSRSHGPLETPWKTALRHLADTSCVTPLLEKKRTSPGLSIVWGNLHYRARLVQEWEWEAEGVKKGSFGCVFRYLQVWPTLCVSVSLLLHPTWLCYPQFPRLLCFAHRCFHQAEAGVYPGLGCALGSGLSVLCVAGALGVAHQYGNCFSQIETLALCGGCFDFLRAQCTVKSFGVSILQEQGLRLSSLSGGKVSKQVTLPPSPSPQQRAEGPGFWPNPQLSV